MSENWINAAHYSSNRMVHQAVRNRLYVHDIEHGDNDD